ncbi:hypothetical protein D3C71_2029200 [compost metagenome]
MIALPLMTKTPPSISTNPGPGPRLNFLFTSKPPNSCLLYAIPVFSEVPDFDLQDVSEAIIAIDAIEYKYDFFI